MVTGIANKRIRVRRRQTAVSDPKELPQVHGSDADAGAPGAEGEADPATDSDMEPIGFSDMAADGEKLAAWYADNLGDLASNFLQLNAGDRAAGEAFARLVAIMRQLRGPQGCPWDREQTLSTLKPYLLEESYEVLDAIDRGDWAALQEELGDLLLQPVFQAQIAADAGEFTVEASLNTIVEKLIRRHPHVFGDVEAATAADVLRNWEQIKREEKAEAGTERTGSSLLDSVPRALPALAEAQRITSRAAKVGFDWPTLEEVLAKFREEMEELAEAQQSGNRERVEDELGDLLFVLVNVARFLKVDSEQALRGTNAKFRARFAYIEQRLREQEKDAHETPLEEMEALWQEAKQRL